MKWSRSKLVSTRRSIVLILPHQLEFPEFWSQAKKQQHKYLQGEHTLAPWAAHQIQQHALKK